MSGKRKHKKENALKPITAKEAKELTCGKMIHQFDYLYDQDDNIIGKSLIFVENFCKSGKPEEQAQKWSLLLFDDGRIMVDEW